MLGGHRAARARLRWGVAEARSMGAARCDDRGMQLAFRAV